MDLPVWGRLEQSDGTPIYDRRTLVTGEKGQVRYVAPTSIGGIGVDVATFFVWDGAAGSPLATARFNTHCAAGLFMNTSEPPAPGLGICTNCPAGFYNPSFSRETRLLVWASLIILFYFQKSNFRSSKK